MKLIIAGGRDFNDYELLKKEVSIFIESCNVDISDIEIVSGTARGADLLGEKYAKEYNIKIKRFPADWSLGKSAGYIRNKQMSEYATYCICFWNNESKGTKHMIDLAKQQNLELKVVIYEK